MKVVQNGKKKSYLRSLVGKAMWLYISLPRFLKNPLLPGDETKSLFYLMNRYKKRHFFFNQRKKIFTIWRTVMKRAKKGFASDWDMQKNILPSKKNNI